LPQAYYIIKFVHSPKIDDRKLYFGIFCHSDPERSEGEESPQETLRLRLRVTDKKREQVKKG